jgi:hypothetical protein
MLSNLFKNFILAGNLTAAGEIVVLVLKNETLLVPLTITSIMPLN